MLLGVLFHIMLEWPFTCETHEISRMNKWHPISYMTVEDHLKSYCYRDAHVRMHIKFVMWMENWENKSSRVQ